MTLLAEEQQLQQKTRAVLEVSSQAPADWAEFSQHSSSCIFNSSEWVETAAYGYRAQPLYACLRQNGEIKTALSGIIYDFSFFRMFFSNMPYGGLIGDVSTAEVFLKQLESELRKENIHQIRITRSTQNPWTAPMTYSGKRAFQHLLDLRGMTPESLWHSYRKNTRRDVQKAKKSGVTVRAMRGPEELEKYYALYGMTMRRNSALCYYTKPLYQEIERRFIHDGKATILFAEHEGKPIAGVLLVYSQDRTYLVGNVSHPVYLKLCPNDLLNHSALENTLQRGLSYFDFMTSEYRDEPLMKFKEKWGADRLPFEIYQKDLSPLRCWIWDRTWTVARLFGRFFINRFDS